MTFGKFFASSTLRLVFWLPLGDPSELEEETGIRARNLISQEFDNDGELDRLIRVYEEAIEGFSS